MKKFLFAAAAFGLVAVPAFAADSPQFEQLSKTDGSIEGGWVVAIPSGSSDYFNVRYDGSGRSIRQLSISVSDFGGSTSFPVVGFYNANTGLDPSGMTPNLASPLATVSNPAILGGPLFDFEAVDTADFTSPATYHAVVQFPPGDPGLVGVGADQDGASNGGGECFGSNPFDSSGFTQDGYSSPAVVFTGADWGFNSLAAPQVGTRPQLRLTNNNTDVTGDFFDMKTIAGNAFGLSLFTRHFGNPAGTLWLLFISFLGTPIAPVGPVLPTIAAPGNEWRYIRLGANWPTGAGNLTINFVAIAGAPGVPGSIAISNEVTVCSLGDPIVTFGTWDDGTFESGWVVAIPAGSSDYFNVNYRGPAVSVSNMDVAVMDFGTSVSAYPRAGVSPENLGVDASGNTPDINNPYRNFAFGFSAGTFATTAGQMTTQSFAAVTGSTPNTHSYIQFPVGDPGLLGVGGDTTGTFISGLSGWSLDGYSTPANLVGYADWGMRVRP
jgi:hypothetical protein